jgi:hypothetical protein
LAAHPAVAPVHRVAVRRSAKLAGALAMGLRRVADPPPAVVAHQLAARFPAIWERHQHKEHSGLRAWAAPMAAAPSVALHLVARLAARQPAPQP